MESTLIERGEKLISLLEASRLFPGARGAARKHPCTLTRYIVKGCMGRAGVRVKLEADRDGSRWVTSREALARFVTALGETTPGRHVATPTARNRADLEAQRQLERMGA